MKDILMIISGTFLRLAESIYGLLFRAKKDAPMGVTAGGERPLEIIYEKDGLIFADYPSLSHAIWRAQEFSLFNLNRQFIKPPALDFGCGDGAFSKVLFKEIEYGADSDPASLGAARKTGLYKKLVQAAESGIPIEDSSVNAVIANSVLEHVTELEPMLSEIHRVLRPGGNLLLSVPTVHYAEDLERYFGKSYAAKVNKECFHANLFDSEKWTRMLQSKGFSVVKLVRFQPPAYTYLYRMARLAGFASILFPNIRKTIWKKFGESLVRMLSESVSHTKERGGNFFIIASKREDAG